MDQISITRGDGSFSDISSPLPNALNQLILTYLRYADYSDSLIKSLFPVSTITFWRKESIKDGLINGVKHSIDDQPFIVGHVQSWYKDGEYHRDITKGDGSSAANDLPAYIDHGRINLLQCWYKNGKCHREGDKPAYIFGEQQMWCIDGEFHRDGDKPAVIYPSKNVGIRMENVIAKKTIISPHIDNKLKGWYHQRFARSAGDGNEVDKDGISIRIEHIEKV